jgi:hypothetical protein
MNEVSLPLTGSCQCGSIKYSVSKAPLVLYACHCTNCQQQTGSAFVLAMAVHEDSLSFTAGEPARFTWISDAGTERYGLFCGDCGGRIANGQTPTIGVYSLRAGTLDDASWVRPAGHIWMRSAQPWFRPDVDDVLCDKQPTDYMPLIQRFREFQSFSE